MVRLMRVSEHHILKCSNGGSLEIGALLIGTEGELEIDLSEIDHFYIDGDCETLIDGYISSGKIVDDTLIGTMWAYYDSNEEYTTILFSGMGNMEGMGDFSPMTDGPTQVPEPGTIVLLGAALAGIAGVVRKSIGKSTATIRQRTRAVLCRPLFSAGR